MRWTRQRRAVLEALRELLSRGVHPTASDILAIARRRVPGISLATVYNALREFERAGLVASFQYNGVTYYDKVEPHLNIICNGEVREVDGAEVWRRIEELGFKPLAAVARC